MKSDTVAGFFLDQWYVFDNFAPFQVEWRGKLYPTSEHAYQAAHFIETAPDLAEVIRSARSPREASDFANAHCAQEDPQWQSKRLEIMEEILRAKLEQHQSIQRILQLSASRLIVEMNDNDSFWGWGPGPEHSGQNQLGNLWMKLRNELAESNY